MVLQTLKKRSCKLSADFVSPLSNIGKRKKTLNKENNVFKDALGVKGLGFKHHGNHPGNHGSHYGNHHGNYHDNHSNHHGNYHAEQLLFSCQCSKVSSCRVVRLSSCQVRFLGTRDMLNININKGWSKKFSFFSRFFRPTSDVNISETGYPIYSKINVPRVASGDSLHFNF